MTTKENSFSSTMPAVGIFMVLFAALGFSAKAIIVKLAYGYGAEVTAITLLTLRMLMSLPFYLLAIAILERNGKHAPMSRRDKLSLVTLGVLGMYLASYLDFLSLSYITASLERLILMLYPTLVIVLSAVVFRRPISGKEFTALLMSYTGVVTVFAQEFTLAGPNIVLGTTLIFAGTTAFAIYILGSSMIVKRLGSTRFTAYSMSIACIATVIHYAVDNGGHLSPDLLNLPPEVYGLALLMAIVATVIPTFLMNAGIKHLGAGPAAIIGSTGPVMTIFLAYLFLDEQLTVLQILGAVLVIAGVYVVSRQKK